MRLYRKVLTIRAEDSPNVQRAIFEMERGLREPDPHLIRTDDRTWGRWTKEEYDGLLVQWAARGCPNPPETIIVPGVLAYSQYIQRRMTWDKPRQCVGLDARFWQGEDALMFPPDWLDLCFREHERLERAKQRRVAKAMGVDPGEGRAETCWVVVDELGMLDLVAKKTQNTAIITGDTLALMRKWGLEPEQVVFDRGGGGLQHADRMAMQGIDVRTVAFGETLELEPKRGLRLFSEKVSNREHKTAYKNRRAQMYWTTRLLCREQQDLNGNITSRAFALYDEELRRQLAPIPIHWDENGKLFLPPKQRKAGEDASRKKLKTMEELIGCSPDRADALVLAIYGMVYEPSVSRAGAV